MIRVPPRVLMAIGLLLLILGISLPAIGPASLRSNSGDAVLSLLMGAGLVLAIIGFLEKRRAD
jgi:hypothetical protein